MIRSYLAAALRHFSHNKLYGIVNMLGLVVGVTTTLLVALFVHHETTYDAWIPKHDTVYRLSARFSMADQPDDMVFAHIAAWLKLDMPAVQAVGRLAQVPQGTPAMTLRYGQVEAREAHFYWGDSEFFDVISLPTVVGDPKATLEDPKGIVLTRHLARKYFGRDTPIGEVLLLNDQYPVTVGAVIEDVPSNSHLAIDAIASGEASYSELAKFDANPNPRFGDAHTYVRLAPGTSLAAFTQALRDILDRHTAPGPGAPARKMSDAYQLGVMPIVDIHFSPTAVAAMKPRGDRDTLIAMSIVGALVALVTAINFIGLTTARAADRAVEVGVRKACGAKRYDLVLQFLGEFGLVTLLGFGIAIGVGILMLPEFNSIVGRAISTREILALMPALYGVAIFLGVTVLIGAYPALVLSGFPPVLTLKKAGAAPSKSGELRRIFVAIQFASLVGLGVAAATMLRQVDFANSGALRVGQSQILLVTTKCVGPFMSAVRNVPGVEAASCSGSTLAGRERGLSIPRPDGTQLGLKLSSVDTGFFELYGMASVAGRLFRDEDHNAFVVNESAARKLGYATAEAAIGAHPFSGQPAQIVGVIPDVSMGSVRELVQPTIYAFGSQIAAFDVLNVKVQAARLPEVLRTIDGIWRKTGDISGPISRRFYDQYIQELYVDLSRQSDLFTAFAGLALFLAGLGLFGLSAFAAQARTKEVGIRKAMGAATSRVLSLLVWQFVKPVLWANLIAWPVAYFAMRRWLEGFAYHVDLDPWIFLAASGAALSIAVLTVSGHAWLVARTQPVHALRYE